jgi:hypothetical protein
MEGKVNKKVKHKTKTVMSNTPKKTWWQKISSSEDGLNPNEDRALKALVTIMFFGVVAIGFISFHKGAVASWKIFGLSLSFALVALLCGGVMGFLFGIPRSLQRGNGDGSTEENGGRRGYGDNTNLEQISDWLTKIIVGVSLTQLPSIERRFNQVCISMSKGFSGSLSEPFAYPFVAALLIFFSICGFLMVYLWAKIYLLQQLFNVQKNLDRTQLDKLDSKLEDQDVKLQITQKEAEITEFHKQRSRILVIENKPAYKPVIDVAKPGTIIYLDDCQKGRWGGNSEIQGYKLSAIFTREDITVEDYYNVTVTLEPTDVNATLEGEVYFFLHDSFFPDCIQKISAENNTASAFFTSFEAFTVGAVCYGGTVKLELDLNVCQDAPDDYKYDHPLKTIDQLKDELNKLKEQQSK